MTSSREPTLTLIQNIISRDCDAQDTALVPIVLGSDKTTVSVATGQNEYYPLYCSIGNVHNTVRKGHRNAVAVLAFLAIPKSKLSNCRATIATGLTFSSNSYEAIHERRIVSEIPSSSIPLVS